MKTDRDSFYHSTHPRQAEWDELVKLAGGPLDQRPQIANLAGVIIELQEQIFEQGREGMYRDFHVPCKFCNGYGLKKECCIECDGACTISEDCQDCGGDGEVLEECEYCEGSGQVSEACGLCEGDGTFEDGSTCIECDGEGEIEEACHDCDENNEVLNDCDYCSGEGRLEEDCVACDGDGVTLESCAVCLGEAVVFEYAGLNDDWEGRMRALALYYEDSVHIIEDVLETKVSDDSENALITIDLCFNLLITDILNEYASGKLVA